MHLSTLLLIIFIFIQFSIKISIIFQVGRNLALINSIKLKESIYYKKVRAMESFRQIISFTSEHITIQNLYNFYDNPIKKKSN